MEECKVLENALKSCQLLENTLNESIQLVRRLNLRYNLDHFVKNYHVYVNHILDKYNCSSSSSSSSYNSNSNSNHNNNDSKSNNKNIEGTSTLSTVKMPNQMKIMKSPRTTPTLTVKRFLYLKPTSIGQSSLEAARKTNNRNLCMSRPLRTPHELCDNNMRINYKFLKIKRNMEAALVHMRRVINIANRQPNYMHWNLHDNINHTKYICCH